jgi:hypothetical protein
MLLEEQHCQARLHSITFQQRRVLPIIIARISRVGLGMSMQALKGGGSTASTHLQTSTARSLLFRRHASDVLHKTKTQYQFYMMLGGPRNRSGGQQNVATPRIRLSNPQRFAIPTELLRPTWEHCLGFRVFRPRIREKFFIRTGKFVFGTLPVSVCVERPVVIIWCFRQIIK